MNKQVVTLEDCNMSEAFRRIVFLLCEGREDQALSVFVRAIQETEIVSCV